MNSDFEAAAPQILILRIGLFLRNSSFAPTISDMKMLTFFCSTAASLSGPRLESNSRDKATLYSFVTSLFSSIASKILLFSSKTGL